MKHAYLILAHNEFSVLERLIRSIDDARNDIYIHFDSKVNKLPECNTSSAGLEILKERVDVRWGDRSVIEAEFRLFRAACNHGGYSYLHLLSGVDMPLRSQDYIHKFMQENDGKEFIGYSQYDFSREVDRKVRLWHLFPRHFKTAGGLTGITMKTIRAMFLRLQLAAGIRRNRDMVFHKGPQWVSITSGFAAYLIEHEDEAMRLYGHTFCPDEIFIQTLCWNSEYRSRIYDAKDEAHGCMRMIGWKDNQIREWTEADFDRLMTSDALFARKFSGQHIGLSDRILAHITGQ